MNIMAKIPRLGNISKSAAVRAVVVVLELAALHTRPTTADEAHAVPKQSNTVESPTPNANVLTQHTLTNLGLCKLQRNNHTNNDAAYYTARKSILPLGGALLTFQQPTLAGCGMGVRLNPSSTSLAPNAMLHQTCPGSASPDSLPSFDTATLPQKLVTFAYLYYRNGPLFYGHLREWQTWPDAYLDTIYFLIVDDGSPVGERAIDLLRPLAKRTPRLSLGFATASCDIGWNVYGARNLLFHVAPTDYVFMLDADIGVPRTLVPPVFDMIQRAEDAMHPTSAPSSGNQLARPLRLIFLRFRRKQRQCNLVDSPDDFPSDILLDVEHPAVMLCSKAAYWLVGGCDEDFVGSYGSTHFRFRAENTPGVKIVVPINIPLLISHSCDHPPPPTTQSSNDTSARSIRAKRALSLSTGFNWSPEGNPWSTSSSRPDRNRSSPHVSRADSTNTALFKAKKHGQLPWSTDYIRFDYGLAEV